MLLNFVFIAVKVYFFPLCGTENRYILLHRVFKLSVLEQQENAVLHRQREVK